MHARRLDSADARLLVALVKSFKGREIDEARARRWLEAPGNLAFAAVEDGTPRGWLLAHPLDRVDRDSAKLLVYEVETHPDHRRRGIGRNLVEAALAHARAEGMMAAWVLTNESNEAAMGLYRSTGARRCHEDDAMFAWALEGAP